MINVHCRDCCCAQSWKALGISEFTGKSIPDHIEELKAQAETLRRDHEKEIKFYRESLGRVADLFGIGWAELVFSSCETKPQETYVDVLLRIIKDRGGITK